MKHFTPHKHSVTDDASKVISIAAVGALFGAAIALLTTTRNGKQLRSDIKSMVSARTDNETIEDVSNLSQDAKSKLKETVNKVVKDAKDTAPKATEVAKKTARRTARKAQTPTTDD